MSNKGRIIWIDIMRGILMISIVMGHIYTTGLLRKYLYSFHVPAFFFLSGYCFHYSRNFKLFLSKKIKTVVIPYFSFSLFSILLFAVGSKIVNSLSKILECNPLKNIIIMLYGNSKPEVMRYNLPLWFLPCLFITSVIAFLVETVIQKKGNKYRIVFILGFAIIGAFVALHENISLPWHFETSCSMLVWYLLGIMLSEQERSREKLLCIKPLCWILLLIAGIALCMLNTRTVGVRNDHYGILPIYYLSAICSIFGIRGLSYSIKNNTILETIGKCSVTILGVHKFPILFFQEILPISKNILKNSATIESLLMGIIVCSVSITFSLLVHRIIVKRVPWVLGRF